MALGLKSWSSGEILTHTDLNNNFTLVENKLGNLRNTDFSDDAGLTSAKFLDRFSVSYLTYCIGGDQLDLTEGTPNTSTRTFFGTGTNLRTLDEDDPANIEPIVFTPMFPTKSCYLCGIRFHIRGVNAASSSDNLKIWFYKSADTSNLIGSDGVEIDTATADATYSSLENSSPFDSHIDTLADGDVLAFRIGKATDTDNNRPTFDHLTITWTIKTELIK